MRSIAALCLFFVCSLSLAATSQPTSSARIVQSGLPIVFEPAPGQHNGDIAMVGRAAGVALGFRPAGVVVSLAGQRSSQFQIDFPGARPSVPKGSDLQKSQTNYLLCSDPAQWRTHVSNYARVIYRDLYPGIDAIFYGNGHQMEHDFIVSPGADYRQIHIHLSNNAHVVLGEAGALTINLEDGSVQMQKPVIYQEVNGERREKSGSFRTLPDGEIGFTISDYDPHYKLIIDSVLSFSTYISTFAPVETLHGLRNRGI